MSDCRHCGAMIRWVRTPAGKAMPLDWKANPSGNVILVDQKAIVLHKDDDPDPSLTRYMPHFVTCTKNPPRRST